MDFQFVPQCCDAEVYLDLGNACAALSTCWDSLRPMGAVFYASVPYFLGYPPEFLISMNLAWIGLSVLLSSLALYYLYPVNCYRKVYLYGLIILSSQVHGFFMLRDAQTALTDVPAACLALIGAWLFILAKNRKKTWMYPLSGLAFGLSALTRAFYLYPVLVMVLIFGILVIGKIYANRAIRVGFAVAALLPILIQCGATFQHTGKWSFIDQGQASIWQTTHLSSPVYGYDTLIPAAAFSYPANECFKHEGGLITAFRNMDLKGIGCLLFKRQNFYFGSRVQGSYLLSPKDRSFSVWILLVNIAGIALFMFESIRRGLFKTYSVVYIFMGLIWFEGSIIIPETRFLYVLYIFIWVIAIAAGFHSLRLKFQPYFLKRPQTFDF